MKLRTKAQKDLILAERKVSEVEQEPDEQVRRIYGGLCHSFPILVRTCGLCQALAFSLDKKTVTKNQPKPRNRAHELLLQHVAALLRLPESDVVVAVREADAMEYMLYTRRILSGWIYFKRFAVSILHVENAREAEEAGDGN